METETEVGDTLQSNNTSYTTETLNGINVQVEDQNIKPALYSHSNPRSKLK